MGIRIGRQIKGSCHRHIFTLRQRFVISNNKLISPRMEKSTYFGAQFEKIGVIPLTWRENRLRYRMLTSSRIVPTLLRGRTANSSFDYPLFKQMVASLYSAQSRSGRGSNSRASDWSNIPYCFSLRLVQCHPFSVV